MTLSRIPLAFLFGFFCIELEQPLWPCLIVFLLVSLTDWLDGKLARTLHVASAFGAWLDVSCDLFFIIVSCLSLWLTGRMPMILPIVIIIKFTEFLLTSHWSRQIGERQNAFFFDPFGRLSAALLYGLPILTLLVSSIVPKARIGLFAMTILFCILSSAIRIVHCLRMEHKQKNPAL
ncbi:CDP-alcohol phosphatidyltransferase [Clostridium sp. MSTE9]|nr:CDP-alcohol phosphatidyltransferase [Clostridium sp. MSTE9]